ncbi:MAG TPA: FkbM family methyltransferase [Dehalococcoidia bacterium]|nr:FkbM family methyltransferase [Dehalococcoidia bacterium]
MKRAAVRWLAMQKRGALRRAIICRWRLADSPLIDSGPLRLPMRWVGNRFDPWAARSAYTTAPHRIHGVQLAMTRPDANARGGEFHMALGTYECREIDYIRSVLRPGDGFLDIGAHIGYYSLVAASVVGATGTVVAFEPTRRSAELLRYNADLNGYPWMKVVDAAAARSDGEIALNINDVTPMWNSIADTNAGSSGQYEIVSARSVDSVMAELNWPAISGIKLDVEGFELDVLESSIQTLTRNEGAFVLFEAAGPPLRADTSGELAVLHFFESRGYTLHFIGWHARLEDTTAQHILRRLTRRPLFNVVAKRL